MNHAQIRYVRFRLLSNLLSGVDQQIFEDECKFLDIQLAFDLENCYLLIDGIEKEKCDIIFQDDQNFFLIQAKYDEELKKLSQEMKIRSELFTINPTKLNCVLFTAKNYTDAFEFSSKLVQIRQHYYEIYLFDKNTKLRNFGVLSNLITNYGEITKTFHRLMSIKKHQFFFSSLLLMESQYQRKELSPQYIMTELEEIWAETSDENKNRINKFQAFLNNTLKKSNDFSSCILVYDLCLNNWNHVMNHHAITSNIKKIPALTDFHDFKEYEQFLLQLFTDCLHADLTKPISYYTKQVLDLLEDPINLGLNEEQIANQLNISTRHLRKKFKDDTNKGFYDTLLEKRVEYAKILIRNSDLSFDEIASTVGYLNTKNFYRIFKKVTNLSVKQYKKLSNKT